MRILWFKIITGRTGCHEAGGGKGKPAGSMDGSQASENTDGTQEEKKTEEEAVIYTCPSCGAQIVTDATTAGNLLLLLPQSGSAFRKIIWKLYAE